MEEILTPCILQTIIICCTVIAVALIGVSAFRVYNKEDKHDSGTYIFISSVVLFITIIVFSYSFYKCDKVLDFISLASALISIILAIVTIIYSFYSNSRSSGQIETLNNAARRVSDATFSYSDSAERLQDNIKLILDKIGQVEQKIDQKNSIFNNNNANTSGISTSDVDDLITNIVTGYVNAGSYFGNLALLACIYSNENKKDLNLHDLENITELDDKSLSSYMCGYIVSSSALGLMSTQVEGHRVIISNILPKVKDLIISMIESYIERSPNQEAKDYNLNIYNKFNAIFKPSLH